MHIHAPSEPMRPADAAPPRSTRRRPIRAAALVLLGVVAAAGCGGGGPPPRTAAEAELERGARAMETVLKRQRLRPETLTASDVVALGYLERHRLGLGSPFRLADYALQDPRLDEAYRTRVAAALLQRTREARGYVLAPGALARIGADSAGRAEATAERHAELIDAAVVGAADPRIGELAVRAGYTLAAAEGAVAPHAATLAAHAAALARDRELARRDVERLLVEADTAERHPVAVLRQWRAERRFAVEAPVAGEPPPAHEVSAAPAALALHRAARGAAAGGWARFGPPAEGPLLAPATARRLAALAAKRNPPPSAPLAVTLARYRDELLREPAGDERESTEGFLERARTEERFAAEHARLAAEHPSPALALVAMESALAMRVLAQEPVWYPGHPAPSSADLRRAYGLAAVEFGPGVPIHWEGYYRRMIGGALADLELVLPSASLRGLRIRVDGTGQGGSALAVHEPRTRTIRLPPESGPGTLAHEIAHDLDWQVAERRYGVRGGYGTDLALRRGASDGLGAAVRALHEAAEESGGEPDRARRAWETRPAESFARMFDGWVAAALAAHGRSNGHLTALQDEVLTAYGMAAVPDVRGWDAEALLPMLTEAAPLSPAAEAAFRARWSPERTPGPYRMVAEIAAAPAETRGLRTARSVVDRARLPDEARAEIAEVERRRDRALAARARLVCANPFLHPLNEGEGAVRDLIRAAADARVDRILARQARAQGIGGVAALRAAWLAPAPAEPHPVAFGRLAARGGPC